MKPGRREFLTGAGALVGHPDSVPGLTGLVFNISGILYGTTISGALGTGRFSNLVRIDPERVTGGGAVYRSVLSFTDARGACVRRRG